MRHWLKGSGVGVRIAAMMNDPSKAHFRYRFEKRRIDPAQLGHERDRQRHFENQPEHHQEPQGKSDILRDRELRE